MSVDRLLVQCITPARSGEWWLHMCHTLIGYDTLTDIVLRPPRSSHPTDTANDIRHRHATTVGHMNTLVCRLSLPRIGATSVCTDDMAQQYTQPGMACGTAYRLLVDIMLSVVISWETSMLAYPDQAYYH